MNLAARLETVALSLFSETNSFCYIKKRSMEELNIRLKVADFHLALHPSDTGISLILFLVYRRRFRPRMPPRSLLCSYGGGVAFGR